MPHSIAAPQVSVIVPAYQATDQIGSFINCMRQQSMPPGSFEVILVDNGGNGSLAHLADNSDSLRILTQPKPGSYAARNLGVQAARGQMLAFTDVDCQPARDWLQQAEANLAATQGTLVVLGGRVEITPPDRHSHSLFAAHDRIYALDQQRAMSEQGFFATANLVMHRETFDAVGPFDEHVFSGGDMRWCRRATALGFQLQYCDAARVQHPARNSLGQLLAKARRTVAADLMDGAIPGVVDKAVARKKALRLLSRPPVGRSQWRRARNSGLPLRDQAAALFEASIIRYAKALECARLSLGGQPNRQ